MITIIDYNAGNITSVVNALKRLDVDCEITSDPQKVRQAKKIIFPGQGAAGAGMKALQEAGLVDILKECKVPFLGICLGMQLLFEKSEENNTKMLGIIPDVVSRFQSDSLKIPQIGWNRVKATGACPLFKNIPDESFFYFVHSYAAPLTKESQGVTLYGGPFASVIQKNNFFGVQFHPEKSGAIGQQLLRNFIEL